MSNGKPSVAIVGAGIAGLAAARQLRSAGIEPTVFEKSRGLGGRMATRRAGEHEFDHGAQYFTAKGDRFRAVVAEWREAGATAIWADDRFVGTPGMTAPARSLADGINLMHGLQVGALMRGGAGGWTLRAADPVASPGPRTFDAVILAVPAPQAVPLAITAGVALDGLADVRMAPCWALLIGVRRSPHVPCGFMRPDDPVIAWIADNARKPGRSSTAGGSLVVHATAEWSRANLELAPETVAAALLERARRLVEIEVSPTYLVAHRWRFALVEQAAGAPCLWNAAVRLGACGDWCIGPRVEAAFDSGEAMARVVLDSLGKG